MIDISNMNLHLNHKHVLKDITLKIPISGEIIGIMGPNGAGKSSLLKSLIGSFNASGEMNLYGKSIHKQLQYITYIPQKAQLDLDFPINVEKSSCLVVTKPSAGSNASITRQNEVS